MNGITRRSIFGSGIERPSGRFERPVLVGLWVRGWTGAWSRGRWASAGVAIRPTPRTAEKWYETAQGDSGDTSYTRH